MSRTKELLSLEYHTDDDTGMYEVGEVDYGIYTGLVEDYIRAYGSAPLVLALSQLNYKIMELQYKINIEKHSAENVQGCAG